VFVYVINVSRNTSGNGAEEVKWHAGELLIFVNFHFQCEVGKSVLPEKIILQLKYNFHKSWLSSRHHNLQKPAAV